MRVFLLCWLLGIVVLVTPQLSAGEDTRIRDLEQRVGRLERERSEAASSGNILGVPFASGVEVLAVGALWARGTGRDPWLWLAAGIVFNLLALLAVWAKHDEDKKKVAKIPNPEL